MEIGSLIPSITICSFVSIPDDLFRRVTSIIVPLFFLCAVNVQPAVGNEIALGFQPNNAKSELTGPLLRIQLNEPYQPNCKTPKDRDDADLCEQRRLARALTDLVKITRQQNTLRYFELGGLLLILFFCGLAAWQAVNSAKKISATLELSRRGYLLLQSINIHKGVRKSRDGPPVDLAFYFEFEMHNYGTVPVRLSQSTASHSLVDCGGDPRKIDWAHRASKQKGEMSVSPQSTCRAAIIDLTLAEATQVHAQKKDLYLRVRVDYTNLRNPLSYHSEYVFRVFFGLDPQKLYNVKELKDYINFQSVDAIKSIT